MLDKDKLGPIHVPIVTPYAADQSVDHAKLRHLSVARGKYPGTSTFSRTNTSRAREKISFGFRLTAIVYLMTKPKLALITIVTTLAFSVAGAAEPDKIYTLLPDTALSGVVDPHMPDRAAIKKAWPKKPADPKNIKVGWAEMASTIPYFIEQDKSAQRIAKKYGMTVDFQSADSDLQRQCSEIDTFVTRKVDVIVVNPTDTLGISKCINRAVDAGIPVVAVGTVPDPSARILTTISPNPYENGFGAGQYIGNSSEKGVPITIALITGVAGNSTAESRSMA
jgi:ribose transport system substrate-binding protein